MKPPTSCAWGLLVVSCSLLSAGPAGCGNYAAPEAVVVALGSQEVAALDADDVVRIMRRAGFSDRQILDLGTELRNAIASTGAAQIRAGKMVEAIFATDGRCIQAATRSRGSFIYDLERRAFR